MVLFPPSSIDGVDLPSGQAQPPLCTWWPLAECHPVLVPFLWVNCQVPPWLIDKLPCLDTAFQGMLHLPLHLFVCALDDLFRLAFQWILSCIWLGQWLPYIHSYILCSFNHQSFIQHLFVLKACNIAWIGWCLYSNSAICFFQMAVLRSCESLPCCRWCQSILFLLDISSRWVCKEGFLQRLDEYHRFGSGSWYWYTGGLV